MPPTSLQSPDLELVEILAHRVRLLSLPQVARLLASSDRCSHARVKRLAISNLLERFTVLACPPRSARIVTSFSLGDEAPSFHDISRELRARSNANEAVAMQVVRLGERGAKLCAVPQPRRPRKSETSHDLQLSEFAVELALGNELASWTSEESLVRARSYYGVVPDGEVTLQSGASFVVECGGAYSAGKLAAFHEAITPQIEARGMDGYWIV